MSKGNEPKLWSLEERRGRNDLVDVFKIIRGIMEYHLYPSVPSSTQLQHVNQGTLTETEQEESFN